MKKFVALILMCASFSYGCEECYYHPFIMNQFSGVDNAQIISEFNNHLALIEEVTQRYDLSELDRLHINYHLGCCRCLFFFHIQKDAQD